MEAETFLAKEDLAWAELAAAIESLPEDRREREGVVPGWSSHDVIWHVAYWVGRAADVLTTAEAGPPYPDEPEELSYYDAENERAFDAGRAMTWEAIRAYLAEARARARGVIGRCEERDRSWIQERYEEEIDHYREHGAQLRAFIEIGDAG